MSHWPIFVISLLDAFERRRKIGAMLSESGFDFEFIDAIDGRAGLPAEYEGQIDRVATMQRLRRNMSDGEYACALSHQKAYSKILECGLPGAIILEDDALILPGFKEFLDSKGYSFAHLIALDHMNAQVWRAWKRTPHMGIELRRVSINAGLNTGYSISRKGAFYLNEKSFPISSVADWPCDVRKIGMCVTTPRLIGHPEDSEAHSYLASSRETMKQKRRSSSASEASTSTIIKKIRVWRFMKLRYWQKRFVKALSFRVD